MCSNSLFVLTLTHILFLFFLHFYLYYLCVKHTAKVEERWTGNGGCSTRIRRHCDIMALITSWDHKHLKTWVRARERETKRNHFCCKIKHLFRILFHLCLSGILPRATIARLCAPSLPIQLLVFRYYENGIRCWWTIGEKWNVYHFPVLIFSLTECICFDNVRIEEFY